MLERIIVIVVVAVLVAVVGGVYVWGYCAGYRQAGRDWDDDDVHLTEVQHLTDPPKRRPGLRIVHPQEDRP